MTTKLLLADDSATIQRVIGLTFAGHDVQVIVAGDGDEAIARISRDRPDIVLADIGMPKRSGYEVSTFVKNHPEFGHVPVVLLAGAFDPVDDLRAKEARCDGVLVKPFDPQNVITTVRTLIKRASMRLEAGAQKRDRQDGPIAVDDSSRREAVDLGGVGMPQRLDDGAVLDAALDDYFEKIDRTFTATDASDPMATPIESTRGLGRPDRPTVDLGGHTFDEPMHISDLTSSFGEASKDLSLNVDGEAPVSNLRVDDVAPGITLDDLISPVALPSFSVSETFSSLPDQASVELPELPSLDLNAAEIPVDVLSPTVTPSEAARGVTFGDAGEPAAVDSTPSPAERKSVVAHAFSALLAAEQGEPWAVPPRLASAAPTPVVTNALADEVARRVFERISSGTNDDLTRLVRQIVSEAAERLIREEIDRIRGPKQ